MQASAGFVSASALGMACGPALAGLLQYNFKIYKFTFNEETLPGWVMAVAWLIFLIWLWISFKEPSREVEANETPQESNAGIWFYHVFLLLCICCLYPWLRCLVEALANVYTRTSCQVNGVEVSVAHLDFNL